MLGFLKFILITFLVLTVLGFVFRLLLRIYILRLAKKMSNQEGYKGEKVGDTYIKNDSSREKIVTKDVGDYVDFEEVDSK